MTKNPFRYFKTSPEIIQLAVMMYVRFPLSLRNVEDLLHERGIDICHESVRHLGRPLWLILRTQDSQKAFRSECGRSSAMAVAFG
jgi:transposase-like protein